MTITTPATTSHIPPRRIATAIRPPSFLPLFVEARSPPFPFRLRAFGAEGATPSLHATERDLGSALPPKGTLGHAGLQPGPTRAASTRCGQARPGCDSF